VVLVVTASGAGRSIAATVHGFASYDPAVRIAGVVLNQVSSPRHEQILRQAVAGTGIPVLGALPPEAALHTPSRHLGLVPAAERGTDVRDWLPALTAVIRDRLDLDLVTAIARAAPPLPAEPWSPVPAADERRGVGKDLRPSAGVTAACGVERNPGASAGLSATRDAGQHPGGPPLVSVAAGPAFTFGYAEHAELLAAAGAEVTEFDPVTAGALPDGTDALVVGGGFPEMYADGLAANVGLRSEVASRVAAGMPVIAECAGLLWLGNTLDGRAQCAALPAAATMTSRLTLGYREAVALASTPLAAAGAAVRAHEFHRTASEPAHGTSPAWLLSDGSVQGWAAPTLLASYLHVHWAGLPDAASRLVAAALSSRDRPAGRLPAGTRRKAAPR
jgi:cobyrinic acid a,c-diamide synthase